MKRHLLFIACMFAFMMANAQETLVTGGQFMDLLLPMEGSVAATADDWGTAAGENTNPKYAGTWEGTLGRWKDNGIEDVTRSYWGGNIIKGSDGKYHIYVSGWLESETKGHMAWSSKSRVYHVKSDNVWGPYEYVSDIGAGHNSEIYKTGDTYVIYHIEPLGIYTSTTLGDSWTSGEFLYDKRGRILIAGENTETSLSNCSFAKREDGSFVMIDRGGGIWVSQNGLADPWHQLTDKSVYLNSEIKNRGTLEDPVIWRDHLQYHMIVNDWSARYAYYYRSLDGLHWIKEAGKAYTGTDPFAKHENGDVEKWHKYERPRVYQDEQGRAIRMNFAVIDCVKQSDLGSDTHSSKNINMPLTKQLLLEVQSINSTSATVLVKAEDGFDPKTDLNFSTLKFGSHNKVNYGNGFSYSSHTEDGDDVIITFTGSIGSINDGEWAPKMLGSKNDGSIAFGYAKMPAVDYKPAMLSAVVPTIAQDGTVQSVSITNYGQSSATEGTIVRVYNQAGNTLLAHGATTALAAYGTENVSLSKDATASSGYTSIQVRFYATDGSTLLNTENIPLTAINAAQAELQTVIDEANDYYEDASLTEGKDALKTAIDDAEAAVACYNTDALNTQKNALNTALNTFKYANASPTNGQSITIPNGTCDDLSEWTMTRKDAEASPGWKINTTGKYGFDGNFIETYKSDGLGVANKAYQTLSNMPAGRYRLRAKIIATRNGSAVSDVTFYASGSTLTGSPVSQAVSTGKDACTEYMLELTLTNEGDIEFGIDIASTTNANWVCFDSWSLKYFGTAEGEIVEEEEEPLSFDQGKVYYIKWNTGSYSKIYWRSPKFNAENDANLHRTANVEEAAKFIIRSASGAEGKFFLYDVVSHQYIVPSANANNGTAWKLSTTESGKVCIDETSGHFDIYSTAGGHANAYANDSGDGDVKNYGSGSEWLIEDAGKNTAIFGINPQAVYHIKHLNIGRPRYMAAEPGENNYLLTTNTEADKGNFSLLPVVGHEGYYYIYNDEGYFVTPAAGNWTLSRSTPAEVRVTLNIDNMDDISTTNATFLLGESSQYANPQKVSETELVKNYADKPLDKGNNWFLEPIANEGATLSLNNVWNTTHTLVESALQEGVSCNITINIGSTGYTTCARPYALDLENLPESIKAYQANSYSAEAVQLTPVTLPVCAGTGLILKGTPGQSYDIPLCLSDESLNSNLLVGVLTETELSADSRQYVLASNGGKAEFQSLADNGATIAAGKAYLNLPSLGAKSFLHITFEDIITNIDLHDVESEQQTGIIYNLQGQRVSHLDAKGVYIINGKKYIKH